jgi:tetratricopeptide (TPR) repeat protein
MWHRILYRTICIFWIASLYLATGANAGLEEDCKEVEPSQFKIDVCTDLIEKLNPSNAVDIASMELSTINSLEVAYRERAIGYNALSFTNAARKNISRKLMQIAITDLSTAIVFSQEYKNRFPNEEISNKGISMNLLIQGSLLFQIDEFAIALNNFDAALKIDPKNAAIWNIRGYTLEKLGRLEEAKLSFQKAFKIDPTIDPKYWKKLKK